MKKVAIVFSFSLFAIVSVALAATAPVSTIDEGSDFFCSLSAGMVSNAPSDLVDASPEPTLFAGQACGVCSYSDCLGAMEGAICTRRFGGEGVCTISGKICGDHSRHCACY